MLCATNEKLNQPSLPENRIQNIRNIEFCSLSTANHDLVSFHTNLCLNIQGAAGSRALTSQLNQADNLRSLGTASRKFALTTKSTGKLAVVLSVSRGLNGRDDLLDGLAILDGSQSTVALAGLAAVSVILWLDTSLQLVFLDIKVVLESTVSI